MRFPRFDQIRKIETSPNIIQIRILANHIVTVIPIDPYIVINISIDIVKRLRLGRELLHLIILVGGG